MFNIFKKAAGKRAETPNDREGAPQSAQGQHKKPGQSVEFKGRVLKAKLEVTEAIKNADKQRAMESLNILSTLAAQAIYEHDLRAMFIVNTALDEINHHIDVKLKSTGEPRDLMEDIGETKMYMMIRLTMLPVRSMMDALQKFSSTGMDEVNNDIDSRINQIRQFVMEHEKGA
ncbi:MAG TPA: hypothetical protein VMC61_06360 [Methanocella sp.]|nr:hypothetical protein [Methanocella sp.]